ncbi:MAG: helix-turn-helix domain-containing protein [Candidatus Symbiobacter sp.]|nr:helix-turn-helix domain-containing protein [Candidatus Symbiobacter sp.]
MAKQSSGVLQSRVADHAPTPQEQEVAKFAVSQVAHLYEKSTKSPLTVKLEIDGEEKIINLPEPALRMFFEVLNNMALGRAVSIIPAKAEFTTQEAADYLNVSRPYLIGLLQKGEIAFHKTGTHRRIQFSDLEKYENMRNKNYDKGMTELVSLTQELGLYDHE